MHSNSNFVLTLCLQRKQPKGKTKAQTDGAASSQNPNAETSQPNPNVEAS
jgi:hypothetical protein